MKENIIPKWEKELKSFIGIKSGIVLEGNIHDEYLFVPDLEPDGEDEDFIASFLTLDDKITSLVDQETTEVVFFNPLYGFYCSLAAGDLDSQKKILDGLYCGKSKESYKNHGNTLCRMPVVKNDDSEDASPYVVMSKIVRDVVVEGVESGQKNYVFVLNLASRLEECNSNPAASNKMFMNLLDATTEYQDGTKGCNTIIMIVDKYNDIPAWLYMNNSNIRTITICAPDRDIRKMYVKSLPIAYDNYRILGESDEPFARKFISETEGLQTSEIRQIIQLGAHMNIPPEEIESAFRLYKYGVVESPWDRLGKDVFVDIEKELNKRVKGQDKAMDKVKNVIARAVKGLSGIQHSENTHKPKGILFFAGPTGVGKTETAKSLAAGIFGDENAFIRFDMSEYRQEQSDQKLFGAPPGYVGYEGGGQLTNAIKNRPFSVVLFDEIEKASPTILDKFLQILDDGRMTDNQGNTVYFGDSIIIFTSNIGLTKETEDVAGALLGRAPKREAAITIEDPMVEDTPEFCERVETTIRESVKEYFTDNGRPELLNRLGANNIVVFQFINVEGAKAICDYKLGQIVSYIEKEKHIRINTGATTEFLHLMAVKERADGGRGVGNMLEREFQNPLADYLCKMDKDPEKLVCYIEDGKIKFREDTV